MIDGQKIALQSIVAAAKSQLNIEHDTAHDIFLFQKANEAIRHLDCLYLFKKKECKLELCEDRAKLPDGFVRLLALRFDCNDRLLYADLDFFRACGCTNISHPNRFNGFRSFEIIGNTIFFHQKPDEAKEIFIAYQGLDVDSKGLMNVYAEYERGAVAYVCWKYVLRYFKDFNQYILEEYKREWQAQKSWVNGAQVQKEFQHNRQEILEWANALISDKGQFANR